MSNIRSYVRLTFKTKTSGNLILDSTVNNSILAVSTHKDISSPMGSFTIILNPRIAKQLATEKGTLLISDIIEPFDLVQIEFKTDQTGYKTEMIGLCSRPTVVLNIDAKGVPQRAIKIDGFDLGKAIQSFKLYFNPYVLDSKGASFGGNMYFGTDTSIFANKNPAEFIQKFLYVAFNNISPNGPFYPLNLGPVGQGTSLQQYVDFTGGISTVFQNHGMIDPFILLGLGAGNEISVYDIIKAYSDPPFHEVFIDLRRDDVVNSYGGVLPASQTHNINPLPSSALQGPDFVPTSNYNQVNQQPYVLYMRTTPFSQNDWNNLRTHLFLTSDVHHQDTAVSEDNIFNYYEVLCERENILIGQIQTSALNAVSGQKVPIFDTTSIQQFGFRRFPNNSTKYVDFITVNDKNNLTIIQKQAALARQLFRWFSYGELFESGTIVVKGRVGVDKNGITMGSRLVEVEPNGNPTGKEYYIEGVMQEWVFGQPMRTTMAVTRGHFPNNMIVNGLQIPGRFPQVAALEKSLGLDQATNGTFFENIPF
jgi:hypothetical protein